MSEDTITPASELRAFKEAAVAAIARMARSGELAHSQVSQLAKRAGLPGPVTSDGTGYTLPDIAEEDTGPAGLPRGKFSAEALAEHDTERLAQVRQQVYDAIRRAVLDGNVPRAAAVEGLTGLGLATPLTRTAVAANITGVGDVTFTLPGKVGKEEIEEKLARQAIDPKRAAVLAEFPDAEPAGQLVRGLDVHEEEGWPVRYDGR